MANKGVTEPGHSIKRVPAVLLHSNPFKEGSENTPWVDIVEPDEGYAIYNGDNRKSSLRALDPRGNALLAGIQDLYRNPSKREYAPPILLFTQCEVDSNRNPRLQVVLLSFGSQSSAWIAELVKIDSSTQ